MKRGPEEGAGDGGGGGGGAAGQGVMSRKAQKREVMSRPPEVGPVVVRAPANEEERQEVDK